MQKVKNHRKAELSFTYFPHFAKFLLEKHLQEFVKEHLRLGKELQLPLLRFFANMTDEELQAFSVVSTTEFLNHIALNKASDQIEESRRRWVHDQLRHITREQVISEDITGISYMRKQAFLKFIPLFTQDIMEVIALIKEIDEFTLVSETVLMDTYSELLNSRIDEHAHFIRRITETSPGIIYVFDVQLEKEVYTNKSLREFLGYSPDHANASGNTDAFELVHPDDVPHLLKYSEAFMSTEDGEVRSVRYRLKNSRDEYRWMRAFESVFRRGENASISQKIGIAIDIHNEKIFSDRLQQNEELYKQAQSIAHLGNWSWEISTNKLEWTDELYRIYGLNPLDGPVDFETVASLNHPDDAERVRKITKESIESLKPYNFYYRIIIDGEIKTLHARGEVQLDYDNKPQVVVGTVQDVSERQNLIEQLQQSEELYKQAEAISHIGNWTWLIKENKILWTDELYRIYGLEPQGQEISFEVFASFIHPDDKENLFNTIQNSLSSREPYELYHRIVLMDGSVKYLNAKGRVHLGSDGEPDKMLGTGQDVTERILIEQEARESQHFISKLADAAPSLIASYNIQTGKYRFISQGLKKLLGYDPQQPLDEGIQFFIERMHPEDLPLIMEKNAASLSSANETGPEPNASEKIIEFEYRLRHANGDYRWFHTFGTIFDRNSKGEVEHVLNISIDITERKEMETVLTQKNLQLQQSNANLEEFAYVASHDLKEPLRKISIFGDRLLSTQYQQLGTEGQFYLEKIIDSSRRMQALINDLLSLSLISGNKAFTQYSLQTVLEEVLRTLEFKIEENKAVIEAEALPDAMIIPSQFRQLFQNLLSNSLKFGKDDEQLKIKINHRWLSLKDVGHYKLTRAKSYLEVTCSDNGIGFDNMFAGKIFAIFQRLNQKSYEGTGIGLAICKKIVENHGGVIFATGEPDKGAIFTFIIPV